MEDVPVRVNEIRVQGQAATDGDFLASHLRPIADGTTLSDVATLLLDAQTRLDRLNIFKECTFELMSAAEPASAGVTPGTEQLDVVVNVVERRRLSGRGDVQQELTTAENSLSAQMRVSNVTGHADWLQLGGSVGQQSSRSTRVEYGRPCVLGVHSPTQLTVTAFDYGSNYSLFSSFRDRLRGAGVALRNIEVLPSCGGVFNTGLLAAGFGRGAGSHSLDYQVGVISRSV
jgi:outer membrane protein assembly factor BamA